MNRAGGLSSGRCGEGGGWKGSSNVRGFSFIQKEVPLHSLGLNHKQDYSN